MRTGYAELPLHHGKAPRWLFSRMTKLADAVTDVIVHEYGRDEVLRRISDPFWFQAFSCVLGFDWHSSGTTTTTCGALRLALKPEEHGVALVGGKGKASRKAIESIARTGEKFSLSDNKIESLKKASRLSAKVDNSCVQDGYELYHHAFLFTEDGKWAVVQQGMLDSSKLQAGRGLARRYHWLSDSVKSFVEEPHSAICSDKKEKSVLDMTAKISEDARKASLNIVNDNPVRILRSAQSTLDDFLSEKPLLKMPFRHEILNIDLSERSLKALECAYELQPANYEELIAIKGVGAKSIRALALLSGIIYGKKASWHDPAKFSFAHGGKDGYPYPVDRKTYDSSIEILRDAVENAKLKREEKIKAVKALCTFAGIEE